MDSYWPFIVFIKESETSAQAKVLDEIFIKICSTKCSTSWPSFMIRTLVAVTIRI